MKIIGYQIKNSRGQLLNGFFKHDILEESVAIGLMKAELERDANSDYQMVAVLGESTPKADIEIIDEDSLLGRALANAEAAQKLADEINGRRRQPIDGVTLEAKSPIRSIALIPDQQEG